MIVLKVLRNTILPRESLKIIFEIFPDFWPSEYLKTWTISTRKSLEVITKWMIPDWNFIKNIKYKYHILVYEVLERYFWIKNKILDQKVLKNNCILNFSLWNLWKRLVRNPLFLIKMSIFWNIDYSSQKKIIIKKCSILVQEVLKYITKNPLVLICSFPA